MAWTDIFGAPVVVGNDYALIGKARFAGTNRGTIVIDGKPYQVQSGELVSFTGIDAAAAIAAHVAAGDPHTQYALDVDLAIHAANETNAHGATTTPAANKIVRAGATGIDPDWLANGSLLYAKVQNVSAAARLLGRGSAGGAGPMQEITIGAGLSLSGTTLSATGSGISDGDYGDIIVSGGGTVMSLDGLDRLLIDGRAFLMTGPLLDINPNSALLPGELSIVVRDTGGVIQFSMDDAGVTTFGNQVTVNNNIFCNVLGAAAYVEAPLAPTIGIHATNKTYVDKATSFARGFALMGA